MSKKKLSKMYPRARYYKHRTIASEMEIDSKSDTNIWCNTSS